MHIVVDLMGSDTSPVLLYDGALEASHLLSDACQISVVVTEKVKQECLNLKKGQPPLNFIIAQDEVLMDESPLLAVRRKHNSSMSIGIKMLKKKECSAFVSAGNTGAITAFSSLELPKLPGISRPALLTELPTQKGSVAILDVGANITFRPRSFFEYALMGSAFQKVRHHLESPKIGLLNIGAEVRKGTKKVRSAHDFFVDHKDKLKSQGLSFEGNIESRDVFHGKVDVLVTDGFTGNVFLKTCEGVSAFILDHMHKKLMQKEDEKSQKSFLDLEKYLDYAEYPGATLIGVDGVVVKCHGSSSSQAMLSGIKGAYYLLEHKIINQIKSHLEHYQKTFG